MLRSCNKKNPPCDVATFRVQVSRWRDDKGFGFITPESGGEDIFVHQTVLNCSGFRALTMGEDVEYTTIPDGDRIKAGKASQPDAWRTPTILPPIVVSSTSVPTAPTACRAF